MRPRVLVYLPPCHTSSNLSSGENLVLPGSQPRLLVVASNEGEPTGYKILCCLEKSRSQQRALLRPLSCPQARLLGPVQLSRPGDSGHEGLAFLLPTYTVFPALGPESFTQPTGHLGLAQDLWPRGQPN